MAALARAMGCSRGHVQVMLLHPHAMRLGTLARLAFALQAAACRRLLACAALALAGIAAGPGCGVLDGDCEERRPEGLPTGMREPCHPRHFDRGHHRERQVCCSDDPATAMGRTPDYAALRLGGVAQALLGKPLFSAARSHWSEWGQCEPEFFDSTNPDLNGCFRPCSPHWPDETIDIVCSGRAAPERDDDFTCCPSIPTVPEDCIFVDGRWRAIRGTDVATPADWVSDHPGTRQDPDLAGCRNWARTAQGGVDDARLRDCVAQLTAADGRGFCMPAPFECPDNPSVDPCEARNE